MTTIQVVKTLPTSDWYDGSGATTIDLKSFSPITIHTKKSLIKIPQPESKSTQAASPSDRARMFVKDLKNVTDTIKIRGWIADDTGETAWNKAWQLRGMAASGGAVTSLTIENVVFSSATQQATLESSTIIAHPVKATMNKDLNEVVKKGIARIEVDLVFFIGNIR